MIYVGLAIVALGAGVLLYDYTASLRRTKDSYKQICLFLAYLRGEIEGSGKPLDEITREYFDNRGSELSLISGAFLPLPRGTDFSSLSIHHDDRERMRSYFECFGSALSKDEELRRLNTLISPIEQKRDEVCERTDKRIKSFYLIYAATLLSAILLIA